MSCMGGLARRGWIIAVAAPLAVVLSAKLHTQPRRSTLTRALLEYGRAVRTVFLLRYLPALHTDERSPSRVTFIPTPSGFA